jgi:aspartyl-tRNA(Asn)/glutamyl-tRNA(Gln) amidotransferase subunit B
VSLRAIGDEAFGTKVEIKNMNSFRNVEMAISYEIGRQTEAVGHGERLRQETRLWDADREETRPMRSKEYAHDYRYFPEPDLVPLKLDAARVESVRAALPELPRARRQRFATQYGLPAHDAGLLTQSQALAEYYESAVRAHANPRAIANWITTELLHEVDADDEVSVKGARARPEHLAGLVKLIDDGTISGKIAKDVFAEMLRSGQDCGTIVRQKGLTQVSDAGALEALVDQAIAANPKAVADFKSGKAAAAKSFVGQVMKASGGKANPAMVDRLVQEKLSRI